MSNPAFSIIIPTHNRRDFLSSAMASVRSQSFQDWELIIVDDGSSDGTDTMVLQYDDPRIQLIQLSSAHGPAYARNRGLEWIRAPWAAFLDSDDQWRPRKLESVAETIACHPDVRIIHTQEVWRRGDKEVAQKNKHQKPDGNAFRALIPICCIAMSTLVVHKEVFAGVGGFDETFPVCEDQEWLLRATHAFDVRLLNEVFTIKYGGHTDQLSSRPGLDFYRIAALAKMLQGGLLSAEEYRAVYEEMQKKCGIYMPGAVKHGNTDHLHQCRLWLTGLQR